MIPVFAANVRLASPEWIEALCGAATEENPIRAASVRTQDFEAHNPQLCLAFSNTAHKEAPLVTVRNTGANNGLEGSRDLHATCDSNNKGRQQREYACSTCYSRNDRMQSYHQDWCHFRTGTAVSAQPLPLELAHLEELRAG